MNYNTNNELNVLFKRAVDRLNGLVILDGAVNSKFGFFEKIKIRKSIRELERCLSYSPNHWPCSYILGKAHQCLGEHLISFNYFKKAMEIELTNPQLPQEASIEAVHLDDINSALRFSNEAIKRNPNDSGLVANHSLYLLIAKEDDEAQKMISIAMSLNSNDMINKNIQTMIHEVVNGKTSRPTCKTITNVKKK